MMHTCGACMLMPVSLPLVSAVCRGVGGPNPVKMVVGVCVHTTDYLHSQGHFQDSSNLPHLKAAGEAYSAKVTGWLVTAGSQCVLVKQLERLGWQRIFQFNHVAPPVNSERVWPESCSFGLLKLYCIV